VAAAPGAAPIDGPTLKAVRARGRISCGVAEVQSGYASRDVLGQWHGFDVDICRAIAAAVLGDARLVRIEPLDAKARFNALQAGQVDLVARGGWTYSRDAGLGLNFVGVSYYDAQGFLAAKSLKLKAPADLAGRKVCVQTGTANAQALSERFDAAPKSGKPTILVFDTEAEALDSYRKGACQALSGFVSALASQRAGLRDPDKQAILTDPASIEPAGPVVRQTDGQWADIVGWTLNAMILAEEFGVTSRSVASDRSKPARPEIAHLLAGDGYGQMLLLHEDWAFQVIRQVGAYDEVFARNLGPATTLKIDRGQNALWSAQAPGLLFAPPMR